MIRWLRFNFKVTGKKNGRQSGLRNRSRGLIVSNQVLSSLVVQGVLSYRGRCLHLPEINSLAEHRETYAAACNQYFNCDSYEPASGLSADKVSDFFGLRMLSKIS
jgi:hypothetical protein